MSEDGWMERLMAMGSVRDLNLKGNILVPGVTGLNYLEFTNGHQVQHTKASGRMGRDMA